MSLKLKRKQRTQIPPLEADTYIATCVGIIDLGEQYNERYKKYEDKIMLIFEIDGETIEQDGEQKPRWLSKECTASTGEKSNMYKYITAFYGQVSEDDLEDFNTLELLGKSAMMEILVKEHSSKQGVMYNAINNVTKLPKKTKPPTPESDIVHLDFDDWNDEMFESLPEWIRDKVRNSPTFQKMFDKTDKVEFIDTEEDEPELPDDADF